MRTGFAAGAAKLLIVRECATVAEERHVLAATSHPNNKKKRDIVNATSSCCTKTRIDDAQKNHNGTYSEFESCY